MNTTQVPRDNPYRAGRGSVIPRHISQTRWKETSLILGSVAGLLVGAFFLSQTHHPKEPEAKLVDRAPALIAESARAKLPAAVEATVPVKVHVEASGEVSETKIESPTPALAALEARAVAAARSYKYQPGAKAGAPSEGWLTVPVAFAPMPNARRLAIKGSDTIGHGLGPAWAGALEAKLPDVQIEIEALGSSTGFAGLLDGSAELAAASRAIKPEEEALAQKLGIELRHAIAGHDGVAVIVHPANPLKQADLATLSKVFSGKVARWSEIGAGDAPIRALGRPSYSGTHSFFREKVLGDKTPFAAGVESVESNSVLVGRVVSDPNAIAYVSLSNVIPSVRVLPLATQAGGAAITASEASLRDGSYPVSRPLLLYWRKDASKDALAYVQLALSPVGQALVKQAGFVPLAAGDANPDAAGLTEAIAEASGEREKRENGRVYFDLSSASLDDEARRELATLAQALKDGKRAIIVGNADAKGKQTSNGMLAKKRADVVASQLRALGVGASSLTIQVANADHPLATNETAEGRKENRRVDVLVSDQ